MSSRLVVACIAMLLIVGAATAQQNAAKRSKVSMAAKTDRIYAETVVVPMDESDSANVHVEVRYTVGSLAFTKVNSIQEMRGNYSASITLGIEARDAMGVVRQRVRYIDTVFVNSYDDAVEKSQYRYGSAMLTLGPGTYTIALEPTSTKDNGLKRFILPKLTIPKRGQRVQTALACFFAAPINESYDTIRPFVFSGNLPFPVSRAAVVAVTPHNLEQTYDVWIRQQDYEQGDIRWWSGVDIHATCRSVPQRLRKLSDNRWLVEKGTGDSRSVLVPFDAREVVPGRYVLTMVGSETKDTLRFPFRVEWELMPMSLRALSYALDALAYICPEDVLDSLREGSEADQRIHLMEWWRRQDPTFGTAHNERMAEYYQRVDYANAEYGTLLEPDGVFTDRGKIYILYGAPSKVDRKVTKAGESSETWIYTNKVRKIFVFTIKENGQYRLTTVQPIR